MTKKHLAAPAKLRNRISWDPARETEREKKRTGASTFSDGIFSQRSITSTPPSVLRKHKDYMVLLTENINLFCLKMCLELLVKFFRYIIFAIHEVYKGFSRIPQYGRQFINPRLVCTENGLWANKRIFTNRIFFNIINVISYSFGIVMAMRNPIVVIALHDIRSMLPICKNAMKIKLFYMFSLFHVNRIFFSPTLFQLTVNFL